METHCLRYTEIPGISRLFADYQYHFDRVSRFYGHDPHDFESYKRAAAGMDFPEARRAALVEALRKTNEGSPLLEELARPGTVAVVTGQQLGLYTGPAYTVYKALTVVKLAEALREAGVRAVPVFWAPTEDHDFAEVNHCHVFGHGFEPVRLRMEADGGPRQMVGTRIVRRLPEDELARAIGRMPFGEEAVEMARRAYRPGVTLTEAFRRMLAEMLHPYELLVVDPLEEGIRKLAAPFLRAAAEAAPGLNTKLRERARELEAAGYHAQVLIEAETSLFFRIEGNDRHTLRVRDGRHSVGEREYAADELAVEAEKLSPNAVLRPVMQDYLLPTVAYAGGPAEIAYFAQAEVIYRELLGRMPVAVPRASFTFVPAAEAERMEKFGLSVPALLRPEADVRETAARRLVPAGLQEEYAEVRRRQGELIAKLEAATVALDPTLAKAMRRSGAKMSYQLEKMEQKVAREALRRADRAGAGVSKLVKLVYPERHLQERYYSFLPFYAEHGPELVGKIAGAVHLGCPDHRVVVG
jgi:bacillithiol biosynthesis cysteine-adding enzyme BshC